MALFFLSFVAAAARRFTHFTQLIVVVSDKDGVKALRGASAASSSKGLNTQSAAADYLTCSSNVWLLLLLLVGLLKSTVMWQFVHCPPQ